MKDLMARGCGYDTTKPLGGVFHHQGLNPRDSWAFTASYAALAKLYGRIE